MPSTHTPVREAAPHRERIITVGLRCSDCPEHGPRCADCQATMDAAVAATLADGIDPRHVNPAPATR
jgi:hypothetical protein